MKKIVSLLVTLLLICTAAYAESPDLAAMSLEELVQLHKAVDAEIDARIGCEPSAIASGVYIAGQSIISGSYTLTCTEAYDENGMSIQVYENQDAYSKYLQCGPDSWAAPSYQLYAGCLFDGHIATISLADGMILVIDGGIGMVQAGKPSWAP